MTEASSAPPPEPPLSPKVRRQRTFLEGVVVTSLITLVLLLGVGLLARYGPVTDTGRGFIEHRLNGMKLGRIGWLVIKGLHGDPWGNLTADHVSIRDGQGVWLDAQDVGLRWRPRELVRRRFHAIAITARGLTILRRPVMGPAGPSSPMPVSVVIDNLTMRLETLPAFSRKHGLFDLSASLDAERGGGLGAQVTANSLLHKGDAGSLRLNLGHGKQLLIIADVYEGQGGAAAGALGLPVDQTFSLDLRATGTESAGWLKLRVMSGQTTPAEAAGAWTVGGGSAQGRVSLAASTLTTRLLHEAGPEARFQITGRKTPDGLYATTLVANAENAVLAAVGPIDVRKRSAPKGLSVDLRVNDLTRIVSRPVMGAGRFKGRASGDFHEWRLKGDLSVQKLATDRYQLAAATGPVDVERRKGEFTWKADLAGTGGAGQGLVAALLGARPHGAVEGVRFKDGRWLLKTLDLTGDGLKVAASGGRGLLGGLDFKGDAQVSNLAAARPGAQGVVSGSWSAGQSRAGDPWTFTFDAKGARFASGAAEVDRLLGAEPRLQAKASYLGGVVTIADADLTGAVASVSTRGAFGPDGGLNLALDWRAQGPFRVGPIEIAGKAKGSGDLRGTLHAPQADLLADFDAIDFPRLAIKPAHLVLSFLKDDQGVGGRIALNGASQYGPAHAKGAFHFAHGGVDLSDIDADAGGVKALGALSLRDGAPSTADLHLAIGTGALLTAGRVEGTVKLADAHGDPSATIRLQVDGAAVRGAPLSIKTAEFTADGPLANLPYTVSAETVTPQAPVRLNGFGVIAHSGRPWDVSFSGYGRVRRADFRTVTPINLHLDGPDRAIHASVSVGGGHADIDAGQTGEGVTGKAVLAGVDLAALGEDLAGKVSANLSMHGKGAHLVGDLDAKLSGARSTDAPANLALDGTVKAVLNGPTLSLDATAANSQGLRASVDLTLPAEASAQPFRIAVNRTRAMQGRFALKGQLQPVFALFFGDQRILAGELDAQGTLGGTLADPRAVGQASLAQGRFEDSITGLKLQDLNAQVTLADNLVAVRQFAAGDGQGGTLSGSGQVGLMKGGASTFSLNVKSFRLLDNDTAKATASGAVVVNRGADGKATLKGDLTIDRGDIAPNTRTPSGVTPMEVIERNKPERPDEMMQLPKARGPSVALDVTLRAPRRVFVRGRGLDVELSLNAHVTGTTSAPVLEGVARVVRGDYDFAGKRFEFDERSTVYLATSPSRIRLDLSATRDDPTLTAVIKIQGTAAKPEITLTSTPVLPNDEVLSQVLFGRGAAQLSGVEAAQLASALAALAGGGGFDVIGNIRNFAHLDRLAMATDEQYGTTIAGGKYLTDNVYLEIAGGGRGGPSAQVEWRVRKTLSLISQVGGEVGARLEVRWRHDYGRKDRARDDQNKK